MSKHKHKIEFEAVICKLKLWHEEALTHIRSPETHDEALALKRQIEAAIGCLQLCEEYQIRPEAQVTILPGAPFFPPWTEFRILDDRETERREEWAELEIENESFPLYPGDIVIR
jgi:hypothetical protein